MKAKSSLANQPISIVNQFKYAFCELASNPTVTIMMSFLTFYYTDVLGINPAVIGTILLVSRVFDGISDIVAGTLVDRTHTKVGSARPWILWCAIPFAVSLVLLFTVPNVGQLGQMVYIFVTYNFANSVCYTIFGAAINALPLYATTDSKSRSSTFVIRIGFAAVIQLVMVTFFMNWIDMLGGGSRAWFIISVIVAICSFISSIITYFSLKENANPYLSADGVVEENIQKVPVLDAFKGLLKNKYWLIVIGLLVCIIFHQVSTLTVGVYYATWVLNDTLLAGKIGMVHGLAIVPPMILGTIAVNKGISKRTICDVCTISMLIGGFVGIFSGTSQLMFYTSLALRGVGYGLIMSLLNGMLSDSIVYGEWKDGISSPAIGMCAYTFAQKIVIGVSTALFGVILGAVGYNGLATVQPESAVSFIRTFFLIAPVVLYVGQFILLRFYDLDKKLPGIMEDLEKRHANQ